MRISEEQIEAGEVGERAAVAFFVAIAGLALAFMGGSEVAPPTSLLYRLFGSAGAEWATRSVGALVALASGLWFVRCMRRLRALKQQRERSLPSFRPGDPN